MPVGPPAILADAAGMANGGQSVYQCVRFFSALIGKLALSAFTVQSAVLPPSQILAGSLLFQHIALRYAK